LTSPLDPIRCLCWRSRHPNFNTARDGTSGKINRMHGDSRDRWMVGLATTNLPASLPVNPLFPRFCEEPKKLDALKARK